MRNKPAVSVVFLSVVALQLVVMASGDIIWDNYKGPNGYDARTWLSSERNTIIADSWAVDDAVFEQPVRVEAIKWIVLRSPDVQSWKSDFIILDSSLGQQALMLDAPGLVISELGAGPAGNLIYEATLPIPNIELPAGRYFLGGRLVDDFLGRNYLATAGNGEISGQSMGMFRSVAFGFDNWTPDIQVLTIGASDFAFRIEGEVIPEPSTLVLLVVGAVQAVIRRR